MGFEIMPRADESGAPTVPVWEAYRHEFPVTDRFVYLNHAAVSPLSRRAATAMKELADDVLLYGSDHYDRWLSAYAGLRENAARLICCKAGEIALLKNTSEGISTIALGIDWRPGDRIVCFQEEFPSNFLPWQRLKKQGVQMEVLSIYDPLDKIDEACRGARLLAISFVNYVSGLRIDLKALGEICRRRGCFYFVDAIQGMGAFPIDVETAQIDALAADGHKWMLGPEGCGLLYIRTDRFDQIEPVEIGWSNVANHNSFSNDSSELRSDAGRYECGTLNTIGCFGLRAALKLLLEADIDRVAEQVQSLGDRIAQGVQAKGYQLLGARTQTNGAGIVSFRKADVDSRTIVHQLSRAGIEAAMRLGWVRTAPHFYMNATDIDRLLAEL